jgi:hypothetical protein
MLDQMQLTAVLSFATVAAAILEASETGDDSMVPVIDPGASLNYTAQFGAKGKQNRTLASGSFTHGTYPRVRPCSSGVLARTNPLGPPPSPAPSAADRSVTWLSPRLEYYAVVRRLDRHCSPLRWTLIGSLLSVPPENPSSPPGALGQVSWMIGWRWLRSRLGF